VAVTIHTSTGNDPHPQAEGVVLEVMKDPDLEDFRRNRM